MKLPYIKVEVEYREEETGAPGKVSPALIVGFGLHWAWVYLFMFNGQYILFPEADSMQLLLSATSGVFHAVALLLYAVFLKQARQLFDTPAHIRRNRAIAAFLVACAALLCMAGNMVSVGPLAAALFVLAGVASGVGSAMLLMSFGVSFSVCDLPTIALCAALSMVVSALAFALTLVVSAAFVPAGALLCLALPFLELLCLNKCSADLVDKLEFSFMTMPVRTASFVGRLGVPSVVFGVLLGILRCCALTGPLLDLLLAAGGAESAFSFSVFAASLFACAALIMAMLTLRKSRNFAFRVLVPLIAVLLVTLCTPYGADGTFRCFALFGSYFMLEACPVGHVRRHRPELPCERLYHLRLRSRPSVRRLPRRFSHAAARRSFEAASTEPMMLALVGLIALTLGVATLPNGAEMRSTLIRGRLCPLLDDQTDLEELMGGEVAASKPSVEEAVVPMPSDTPGAVSSAPGDIPEPATPAVQESPEQRAGRFKRKCAAVADTFLLSRKETEVLFLLAKGRNSAAIQEALYISAGTANTHMRHIYRKLDVHSQHELIDLVESMVVD